jgi:hypothetical protein
VVLKVLQERAVSLELQELTEAMEFAVLVEWLAPTELVVCLAYQE